MWPLYHYDPRLIVQGKPPLQIDGPAPRADVRNYLRNETRFSMIEKINPERFRVLSDASVRNTTERLELYTHLAGIAFPEVKPPAQADTSAPAAKGE